MADQQTKLARAAYRLGQEARAWDDLAYRLLDLDLSIARRCRARAGEIREFVTRELGTDLADTPPTLTIPVALAGRLLDALPSDPCCSDVTEGGCSCPRGMLRRELRAAIAGVGREDEAVEPALEEVRR